MGGVTFLNCVDTLVNANLDLEKFNDQETQSVRRQQGENKSTQRVTPCLKNYREALHSFQTQSMENEIPLSRATYTTNKIHFDPNTRF